MSSCLVPSQAPCFPTLARGQVCGSDGLPCAALSSLKLRTSVQLGSVLTLVGRDHWEKFFPPNGKGIPSCGGIPKRFLAEEPKASYLLWLNLSFSSSKWEHSHISLVQLPQGPPEITQDPLNLRAVGHHFFTFTECHF